MALRALFRFSLEVVAHLPAVCEHQGGQIVPAPLREPQLFANWISWALNWETFL